MSADLIPNLNGNNNEVRTINRLSHLYRNGPSSRRMQLEIRRLECMKQNKQKEADLKLSSIKPTAAEEDDNPLILCKICYEYRTNVLMEPCSHAIICNKCCIKVKKCPLCRTDIENKKIIYIC